MIMCKSQGISLSLLKGFFFYFVMFVTLYFYPYFSVWNNWYCFKTWCKYKVRWLYVCDHANTGNMLVLCICNSSYIKENLLILPLSIWNRSATSPRTVANNLLGDRLKTRKTYYRLVWSTKGFRCSCKNLQPTKINQWQPLPTSKEPFYELWQPTAEQRCCRRSATSLYLCVTGAKSIIFL